MGHEERVKSKGRQREGWESYKVKVGHEERVDSEGWGGSEKGGWNISSERR